MNYSGGSRLCQCGLVGLSAQDVAAYAFVASRSQSWELQDHILRNSGVANTDPDYASALERLHESLPDFDLGGFSNKDTAPKKATENFGECLLLSNRTKFGRRFPFVTPPESRH